MLVKLPELRAEGGEAGGAARGPRGFSLGIAYRQIEQYVIARYGTCQNGRLMRARTRTLTPTPKAAAKRAGRRSGAPTPTLPLALGRGATPAVLVPPSPNPDPAQRSC